MAAATGTRRLYDTGFVGLDEAVLGRAAAQADRLVSAIDSLCFDNRDFSRLQGAPRGYLTAVLRGVVTDLESIQGEADGLDDELSRDLIGGLADSSLDNLRALVAALAASER